MPDSAARRKEKLAKLLDVPWANLKIPLESPWQILLAHLANDIGGIEKILEIKEYLYTLNLRDTNDPSYDAAMQARLAVLHQRISKAYFVKSNFTDYLPGGQHVADPGAADFQICHQRLLIHLKAIDRAADPRAVVVAALGRSIAALERKLVYTEALSHGLKDANNGHETDFKEHLLNLRTTEVPANSRDDFLQRMAPKELQKAIGTLTDAIAKATSILQGRAEQQMWVDDVLASVKDTIRYLENPAAREQLTLVDLTFYIGEHRDASDFRKGTTGQYAPVDTYTQGLVLRLPHFEDNRWTIDLAYSLIDPNYNDAANASKLALINTVYGFNFTSAQIDAYGTISSMLGSVLRGFDIDEIDDRLKQYLHNTGDHSLRTIITIASMRDTVAKRLKELNKQGRLPDDQLQRVLGLNQMLAQFLAQKAILHDDGEFLCELLGNNLVGKSEKEEKFLKMLRDRVEQFVAEGPVLDELRSRLNAGHMGGAWGAEALEKQFDEIKRVMGNAPIDDSHLEQFQTKFFETVFKIVERLNTSHDIIAQRAVGKINPDEGSWRNRRNVAYRQIVYSLLYPFNKVAGHKDKTIDSYDKSVYYSDEYDLEIARKDHEARIRVATVTSAPPQFDEELQRVRDRPETAMPIDDFLAVRDLKYKDSLFRSLVRHITGLYKRLSASMATDHQWLAEAWCFATSVEALHYSKKMAQNTQQVDADKVERAGFKTIAQGVAAACVDLKQRFGDGITFLYLQQVPIHREQRYRILTVTNDTTRILGVSAADPEKPYQITDYQLLIEAAYHLGAPIKKLLSQVVFKPLNTIPARLRLRDLDRVSDQEFETLLWMTSVREFAADAGLTATGLLQGSNQAFSAFLNNPTLLSLLQSVDPKSFAVINPFITAVLQNPDIQQDAIRKCYGYILAAYPDAIASKDHYDIPPQAMREIAKRRHMNKGDFDDNPFDPLPSGYMAKQFHDYFVWKYGEYAQGQRPPCPLTKKMVKIAERAERLRLDEIINERQVRLRLRCEASVCPAEQARLKRTLEKLTQSKASVRLWKRHRLFALAARDGMTIRFGSIALLGALMAKSGVGVPIAALLFGLNLCSAGGSAMLANIGASMKKRLGHPSRLFRGLHNLPYFVRDPERGVYIHKGRYYEPFSKAYDQLATSLADGVRTPNSAIQQLSDMTIALMVTPVRVFSNMAVSSSAFARQNAIGFYDSLGILYTTIAHGPGVASTAQAAVSYFSTRCFFRTGNNIDLYNEIKLEQEAGGVAEINCIKKRVAEKIKKETSPILLNLINNAAAKYDRHPVSKVTRAVSTVLDVNSHVEGMARVGSRRMTAARHSLQRQRLRVVRSAERIKRYVVG